MKTTISQYHPIEWMHPSWRDLVIDHLASNDHARQSFLRRCGLHGFVLALSSAGGATGERNTPLLVRDEDWDSLTLAVLRVIESDPCAAGTVLATIHEALQTVRKGDGASKNRPVPKLIELAETTLNHLRENWSQNGVNRPAVLDLYFLVSEMLPRLLPGPELSRTWEMYTSDALAELNEFDAEEFEIRLSSFTDWIDLAATIGKNEPRFLRQVGFPAQIQTVIAEFVPRLNERAEIDFDLDDADECRDEQKRLEKLAALADKITELFPLLKEQLDRVAFLARLNERRVDGRREYLEEQREPDIDESLEAAASITTFFDDRNEDPFQESVDIHKLFEDL